MVIRLSPDHLGELTLKIVVNNSGGVSAAFHSANLDVRGVIEASLAQLRQELSNQGLKVNHVGVYSSLNQFNPNQDRSMSQQQTPKNQNQRQSSISLIEPLEDLNTIEQSTATGIDYRI